ncbi:winged helix-turn-helix DNA-binding protein [Hephaestia caeni]|uniref:Winged helix-turn-helix DNA-binding protein n=1 Tax=Hephaestia caeni TaxID=645617 RepID=A0A397PD42_9SPHN|nr:helix-turn-helix domain-containing protein [Hephaestia caeni]RIA44084.1 winged helix-turn-helix DNA-binding protein [Hephaestia caeni]
MTLLERAHPEDIKAVIRKRYRSLAAFERAEGLARESVSEVLRGRPSARTAAAIERVLREQAKEAESIIPVPTNIAVALHRHNAEAR